MVTLLTSPAPSPPLLVAGECAGRTVVAVIDEIRAIAKERLQAHLGEISPAGMEAVEAGVLRILDLG